MGLNTNDIKQIIIKIAGVIESNKEYLTELDSAIGDADHGINMSKGFKAVEQKLAALPASDIGGILKTVGITLVSNVGGASGPLYGTAFMRAGASAAGKSEIGINDFIVMMTAALEGIKMRGKAELGDKTMVDALEPALSSLKESVEEGASTIEALGNARDSAKKGMEGTKEYAARKGRAGYLGDRSIGHQDPGATSSYLMLDCIYNSVKEIKG